MYHSKIPMNTAVISCRKVAEVVVPVATVVVVVVVLETDKN